MEVDVSIEYLEFFMEDDVKLAEIKQKYAAGEMLTGEVKKILIEILQEFVKNFQEARAKITDADVEHFMSRRKIDPYPTAWKAELEARAAKKAAEDAEKKRLKDEKKAAQQADEAANKEKKKAEAARKKAAAVEFAKKKKEMGE